MYGCKQRRLACHQRAALLAPGCAQQTTEALAALIEVMPSGVIVVDAAGHTLLMNAAGRRMMSTAPNLPSAVPGRAAAYHLRDAQTGHALAPAESPLGRALAGETVEQMTFLYRGSDALGDACCLASATPRRDAAGRIIGAIAVFEDVTRERRLQQHLAISEERLRTVYAAMACGVVVLDAAGDVVDANHAAQQILDLSLDELRRLGIIQLRRQATDANGAAFSSPRDRVGVLDKREPAREILLRFQRADGQERWLQLSAVPVLDAHGNLEQMVLSFLDTTDRVRAEEALRHQMLHDTLTGLPNRIHLQECLEHALQPWVSASLALLLLDLDHFKDINDTFGHDQGDRLLQEVAQRVRGVVPPTTLVARLGGDEFAVLLPGVGADGALTVMHGITAALMAPIEIAGHPLHVATSIGIVVCPDHGTDARTLLRRADVAMYAAKRAGDRFRLLLLAQMGTFQCCLPDTPHYGVVRVTSA